MFHPYPKDTGSSFQQGFLKGPVQSESSLPSYENWPLVKREKGNVSRGDVKCARFNASRALIMIRRSKAESSLAMQHFNIQDNFVIDACTIRMGIDVGKDVSTTNVEVRNVAQDTRVGEGIRSVASRSGDDLAASGIDLDGGGLGHSGSTIDPALQELSAESESSHDSFMRDISLDPQKIRDVVNQQTKLLPSQVRLSY